jgi:hypothetical protein
MILSNRLKRLEKVIKCVKNQITMRREQMIEKVELGDRVMDKITGLKGIAIGITQWLYGCSRVSVQPEEAKDGKPAESFCVDEPQLEIVKKNALVPPLQAKDPEPAKRNHGPRDDATRRKDVAR